MQEIKGAFRCVICGKPALDQKGHNAEPLSAGKCCDDCFWNRVLPRRIADGAGVSEKG